MPLSYVKQPMDFSVLLRELKLGLCNNLEGWEKVVGRREGTYVNLRLIHVAVWPKSNQYCKAIIFQFKKNKLRMMPSSLSCLQRAMRFSISYDLALRPFPNLSP